jgi:DNA-binding NarL/FixJ family response regulator
MNLRLPAESHMIQETQQETLRVVIIDSQSLFRSSLGRFLASTGFDVLAECATSGEALDFMRRSAADVILLDYDLADPGDMISLAREAGYQGRFLIIAGAVDARKSALAIKMGASGIFLKSEPPDRLVQAIHLVAEGRVWIDQQVIQLLAGEIVDGGRSREFIRHPLDDRERKVLRGILSGYSNRTIAVSMGVSESSVKNIVQRLFHKGGVKTRGQLVRMALEGAFGTPDFFRRNPDSNMAAAMEAPVAGQSGE